MKPASFRLSVALAVMAVVTRIAAFDYRFFFPPDAVPNHDMYQGAAFFATSMHSVALSGDIAWWNPIASNGYAQYFQAFFSPLAPTPHSIVFIVWAQAVWLFSLIGVRFPEYYQYLVITYIVLPFLTFVAVALFASLLFKRRAVVAFVVIIYAFSGIGLWNSAWFYFQESASLFFLLAATIAFLRMPSRWRLLLFLLAIVNQVTSVNYWTLYNAFFVAIVLAAFLIAFRRPLRRLRTRHIRQYRIAKKTDQSLSRPVWVASVLCLASVVVWGIIGASIISEQGGSYVRTGVAQGSYATDDAYRLIRPIRYYTLELFNPEVDRATEHYPAFEFPNPMHNARYIGAVVVPLLVLLPCYRWRRREQWLVLATLGTLVICFASPFVLLAWTTTPFMNRIQHVFYFYSHYWQLMLVLLAAACFDKLMGGVGPALARRALRVVSVCIGAVVGVLVLCWALSSRFTSDSLLLQAALRSSILILIPFVLLVQRFLSDSREARQFLAGAILLLSFADLTKYFYDVSSRDMRFTEEQRYAHYWNKKISYPLASDIRRRLMAVWATPDRDAGFASTIYSNMPVPNSFWPENTYIRHRELLASENPSLRAIKDGALTGPPLEFFCDRDVRLLTSATTLTGNEARPPSRHLLWLADGTQAGQQAPVATTHASDQCAAPKGPLVTTWREWSYNTFEFDVVAPADGFVMVRQLADPRWRISIDGRPVMAVQANIAALAVKVSGGPHRVRMDYQPMSRRLYWPAGILLETTWVGVLIAGLRWRRT